MFFVQITYAQERNFLKLRHYLEWARFTVVTDHWSFLWLNHLKDPTSRLPFSRLLIIPLCTAMERKTWSQTFLSRSVTPSRGQPHGNTMAIVSHREVNDPWYRKLVYQVQSTPLKHPNWRFTDGVLYKYVKCSVSKLSTEAAY